MISCFVIWELGQFAIVMISKELLYVLQVQQRIASIVSKIDLSKRM